MRILHCCEFYPPYVGGMPEVVLKLSTIMQKMGHEVHVATTQDSARSQKPIVEIDGVTIHQFEIEGNISRGIKADPAEVDRYISTVTDKSFDVVVLFAAQQWTCDIALANLQNIPGKKIFVPTGYSALWADSYKPYFDFLNDAIHCFDHSIYLSSDYRDINFAKDRGANNFSVIPNGAAKGEFEPPPTGNKIRTKFGISDGTFLLLSVASHTGIKGHKEMIEAFDTAEVSDSTLLIIGREEKEHGCSLECQRSVKKFNLNKTNQESKKRIILSSLPRSEVVEALFEANLFLFLSNLECSPIVLFEATAAGLPFISTPVGNAVEISRWLSNGLICEAHEDPSHSYGLIRAKTKDASRLIELVKKDYEKEYKPKAQDARKLWLEKFTWEKIAEKYLEVYQSTEKSNSAISQESFNKASSSLLTQLLKDNSALHQEIDNINTSHSMRITAPIRKSRRLISHILSYVKKEGAQPQ